jgi:hypothetical protein
VGFGEYLAVKKHQLQLRVVNKQPQSKSLGSWRIYLEAQSQPLAHLVKPPIAQNQKATSSETYLAVVKEVPKSPRREEKLSAQPKQEEAYSTSYLAYRQQKPRQPKQKESHSLVQKTS